ncbi:hypothetical protein [Arthrobacter sp. STN4]|uniref:hypothetical protein n=1 Tax=Arthrobacter sp. STN4 TaxID=2923276 RepID=UPI002119C3C1|nr:hypothetical protein [Arthrobacter sp. STN4]MCQ9162997.1 hypothetical protein [Arthrobacter sp. STN4]
MRLEEYVPTAIARLTARVREHLAVGDDAAALVYLQKQLSLMEQVLDGDPCPPLDAPASIGDHCWRALISAALLDLLGDQWPEPEALPEPWFPMGETGADRAETEKATPAILTRANIFTERQSLRWPPTTAPLT